MTSRFVRLSMFGILTLLLPAALAMGQDLEGKDLFEGVLTVEVRDIVSVQIFTYSIKDGILRIEGIDREDAQPIVLVDYWLKKTFVMLPEREEEVVIPYAAEHAKSERSTEPADIEKTDSTEAILNFKCDQFLVRSGNEEIEVWATKQLGMPGSFITRPTLQTLEPNPWQEEILSMGYFPLLMIRRDSTGDEKSRFEVTGARKKILSESRFHVPSSYELVGRDVLQPKTPPKKRTR